MRGGARGGHDAGKWVRWWVRMVGRVGLGGTDSGLGEREWERARWEGRGGGARIGSRVCTRAIIEGPV